MMNDEIKLTADRLARIQHTGKTIAETAAQLKEVADALRADVDALAERVSVVENNSTVVAENLVTRTNIVRGEQVVQDGRLDTLEN